MEATKTVTFKMVESEEMVDQCQCCAFDQKNCIEDCDEEWYWEEVINE